MTYEMVEKLVDEMQSQADENEVALQNLSIRVVALEDRLLPTLGN